MRLPTTVVFTDIVDSTVRAGELGDEAWARLLANHHATVRRELRRHGGREIDTAGDGFFVAFTSPADAIKCACAIVDAVKPLGIEIRAGIHVGEIVQAAGRPGGMGVHIGARVGGLAGASEVLVSGTVRDLVEGSGIAFEDRGSHTLKGVTGDWRVLAVLRKDALAPTDAQPVIVREPRPGRKRAVVAAVAITTVAALVTAIIVTRPDAEPTDGGGPSPSGGARPISALYRLDGDTGEPAAAPDTTAITFDLVVAEGFLWVNELHSVLRRSLTRDTYGPPIQLDAGGIDEPQALAVHPSGLYVFAVGSTSARFYRIDPAAGDEAVAEQVGPLDAIPDAAVATRDYLWISASSGLGRIPVANLDRPERIDFVGTPVALDASEDFVYVADANGRVVMFDAATGDQVRQKPIGEPTALALGQDSLWVTSDEFGTGGDEKTSSLVRLDPATLEIQDNIPLPNAPDDIVVTDEWVWVACLTEAQIVRVDPQASALVGEPVSLQDRDARLMRMAATAEDVYVSVDAR